MGTRVKPPGQRTPDEWRRYAAERLGSWWTQWEPSLKRHDDLAATVAAGDNLAFFAKQMGLGRQKLLAEALVGADMWDRQVLVLCPPALRLHWHNTLRTAGFAAERIDTLSAWQLNNPAKRARSMYYIPAKLHAADVVIIEPPCRPGTKLFAALARQVKASRAQIVTTTTMVWGSATAPPRYVDSCLKLLGYLDAPDDIRVCWADDCWEAAA